MLFKVIRCCANRRGIYDLLLALNSNLTSVSKVLEISRLQSVHLCPTYLLGGTEKDVWE